MILDWLAQTSALVAGVLVVFVPGLLALWGVGLRGLPLVAAAPLFGVAGVGLSAIVLGAAGIPWSPWTWALCALVLVVVAWVVGRVLGSRLPRTEASTQRWLLPSALAIGILLGTWRLVAYIGDPAAISQTNDAVFHMNAVRYVLETASASSMQISSVVGGSGFYPAAWHGVVSLIVMITGASIPVAANMFTLVIGAMVWPLGIAWLTREATGSGRIAAFAAVLSGALQTFPLLMFQWGVLFPNALSTALVPAAIALAIAVRRWGIVGGRFRSAIRGILLVLVAAAALLLSQPSGVLPWLTLCAIWFTFRAVRRWRMRRIALVVGLWLVLAAVWYVMAQGTSGSHWAPFRGKAETIVDVLLNGQMTIAPAYALSALMLLGLVIAIRRRELWWFVAAWGAIAVLYFLSATVGNEWIRNVLLAPWYADPYRIAALAPLIVIPLAAVGVDGVVRAVEHRVKGRNDSDAVSAVALVGVTVLVVTIALVRSVAMPEVTKGSFYSGSTYVSSETSYLTPDERGMLEALDGLVDPGAVVIANPSTGAGFGYMLSDVNVYPRTWSQPTTADWQIVAGGLRDAASNADVCAALTAFGSPGYVLDFGLGEAEPGRYQLPAMTGFAGQDGFELVAEHGDVSLWRITACEQ